MVQFTDEVEYLRVFWMRWSKGHRPSYRAHVYEVLDAPTCGWSAVFVMRGEKRTTLVCPFSLQAEVVSNKSGEAASLRDFDQSPDWADTSRIFTPERMKQARDKLLESWEYRQRLGLPCDFDMVASLLRKLDMEVPTRIMRSDGEEDTRKRGGKETWASLLKPVTRNGKRGKFLQWFLDNECTRSIRETMAEFEMTRSNALSYLYMLNKDHGIGYELVGDAATVHLPSGCKDPFDA